MERVRKSYSREFKLKAVELSNSSGSVLRVANELGISYETLKRWKKDYNSGEFTSEVSKRTPEQEEIIRLRKALRDAIEERDILKKVVGIFSEKKDR